ncbi:hypothetical protein [Sandaracinus amylolyticus]|uniref:hypothetical protein n=1 Tax=Sandaracinus amylolyticus TaxID=927083 RepID=UPI001F227F89|nr:hypothetical protein [Sandaracinus amylolyticus]
MKVAAEVTRKRGRRVPPRGPVVVATDVRGVENYDLTGALGEVDATPLRFAPRPVGALLGRGPLTLT